MKTIRTFIDERGNVYADFVGYAGEECALAEEELRKALAELGLLTSVEALRLKSLAEIAAEVGLNPREGRDSASLARGPEGRKVRLG
jgi:hypothetical protein